MSKIQYSDKCMYYKQMILGGKGGLRERSRTKKGTGWETKGRQGRGKGTGKPKPKNNQKLIMAQTVLHVI